MEIKFEKEILEILLENCSLLKSASEYRKEYTDVFSRDEALWLTKESWERCRLKNLVSIQPMIAPTSLAHYQEGDSIKDVAIPARVYIYDFKVFSKVKFDEIKNSYADIIASHLDGLILDLIRQKYLKFEEELYVKKYDFIASPKHLFNELKSHHKETDILEINEVTTMLAGQYPKNVFELPIFCPYILLDEFPTEHEGVFGLRYRGGDFDG